MAHVPQTFGIPICQNRVTQSTKFCIVIILGDRKVKGLPRPHPWGRSSWIKILVARILTGDVFAMASLFVIISTLRRNIDVGFLCS